MNILTISGKSDMPDQLKALAEEAGVPFNAEEAMKLLEDPEVLNTLGLGSLSGLLGGAAGGSADGAEGGEGAAKEGEAAEGLGGLVGCILGGLGKK